MANTAYKQWRASGGAKVGASHNCSCTWTGDRSELRHCSYAKTLAFMLRKATDRPIDYKIENEITDKEEKI